MKACCITSLVAELKSDEVQHRNKIDYFVASFRQLKVVLFGSAENAKTENRRLENAGTTKYGNLTTSMMTNCGISCRLVV